MIIEILWRYNHRGRIIISMGTTLITMLICRFFYLSCFHLKSHKDFDVTYDIFVDRLILEPGNAHSFISKGKDHVPSTSQKAGLTGLYKKLLFMSTTAISKPVFQEVDSTVKGLPFKVYQLIAIMYSFINYQILNKTTYYF